MKLPGSPWVPVSALLAAPFVAAAVCGAFSYPGSVTVYTLFNLAFLLLLALIFPRPRLYVYTFLALLLFLGFWMKTIVQTIWTIGFIEPTGDFDATGLSWDNALTVATLGALGVASARLGHVLIAGRAPAESRPMNGAPRWFVRSRMLVWTATILLVAGLNLANFYYAFYQVGVNARLVLPAHLNVPVAWLVNTGFALWLAALVFWEFQIEGRSLLRGLQLALFEGLVSTVSTLSRQLLLLHLLPYLFAIAENWSRFRGALPRRGLVRIVSAFVMAAIVGVSFVFLLRVLQYNEELTTLAIKGSLGTFYPQLMIDDVPKLFVHRWVGLEGVLSATAAADRGQDSLLSVLKEDPKRGGASIFQRVAKTPYLSIVPQTNTFLSNAGITAILAFSGSLAIVFLGMALTMTVLILTEWCAQAFTGNPFFVAMAGAGAANVISQATFPYLTAIYLFQLWVAIAFIGAIQRAGPAAAATPSGTA